jgi:hypothetical protein
MIRILRVGCRDAVDVILLPVAVLGWVLALLLAPILRQWRLLTRASEATRCARLAAQLDAVGLPDRAQEMRELAKRIADGSRQ